MTDYGSFLASKEIAFRGSSIAHGDLHPGLFDWQRDITAWALRRGRAAIFADCGLGKTLMQLEWARHVPGRVLVLAPLAVAQQTEREGAKFGIDAKYLRADDGTTRTVIANYEMLDHFDPGAFAGVVLDESSILKAYDGATRTRIIEAFRETPYRLACTATPAPNDHTELANHAEFLGAMSRGEMLATFFCHDGGKTQDWRLKGHARTDFWRWVASWAMMLRRPSDLGYSDEGFDIPPLHHDEIVVGSKPAEGMLFAVEASSLSERLAARRASLEPRSAACADLLARETTEPWVVWCNLNAEAEALCALVPDAVEVRGTDDADEKERKLIAFSEGKIRVLVTKPSIAGFGMNWQHCARMAFLGLSDSWEQMYQATRRCWRFGQKRPVHAWIVSSEAEGAVVANVRRKARDAEAMLESITEHARDEMRRSLGATTRRKDTYMTGTTEGDGWRMHLGDCVETVAAMEPDSIHYSVFSPPFASLYTYTASDRDMGNSKDGDQFNEHFVFLVAQLLRVLKPGRLVSVHCMNLPTSKAFNGYIGIRDFRGDIIRAFTGAGFYYHSEVCVWKDPVTSMQRTKALGLLYKTLRKDSCMSRMGIPDYVCTFRKPGENPEPVAHEPSDFPLPLWQNYASPVWDDVNPSDTLQHRSVREDEDERHICPLQLQVIRRCVKLWSNEGDVVLSPFAGIGSEGYCALEMGRKFVGVELKRSYHDQAVANLRAVRRAPSLFDGIPAAKETA